MSLLMVAFGWPAGALLVEIISLPEVPMIITPGGIGAYAYLIEATMQLYGLQQSIAVAFGWLLWIAQTIIILVVGLFSFALIPWYNKRKRIIVR